MAIERLGKPLPRLIYSDIVLETHLLNPAVVLRRDDSIDFDRTNRVNPQIGKLEIINYIQKNYPSDHYECEAYLPNAISSSYVRMFE